MPLSDDDVDRIVRAMGHHGNHGRGEDVSPQSDFYIAPKDHYDQHQRLDRMLEAYESAQSQVWKWVLGIVLTGTVIMSGVITKAKALVGL